MRNPHAAIRCPAGARGIYMHPDVSCALRIHTHPYASITHPYAAIRCPTGACCIWMHLANTKPSAQAMSRKRQNVENVGTRGAASELGRGIACTHQNLVLAKVLRRLRQKTAVAQHALSMNQAGPCEKVQEPLAANPEQLVLPMALRRLRQKTAVAPHVLVLNQTECLERAQERLAADSAADAEQLVMTKVLRRLRQKTSFAQLVLFLNRAEKVQEPLATVNATDPEKLAMSKVLRRLRQRTAFARHVLLLTQTGYLDKLQQASGEDTAADPEQVPNSRNKFRLLSKDMQRDILYAIEPGLAEHVAKLKPKAMRDLLCFALNVRPSSVIFSYNKRSLLRQCQVTYMRNGHRLQNAKWKDSAPDWTSMGYFSFVSADGPGATRKVIKHVSGAECELPEGLRNHQWCIQDNHSHSRAKLVSDKLGWVPIVRIFRKAFVYVKTPLCLRAAPARSTPSSSPAAAAPSKPASDASCGFRWLLRR